MMPLYITKKVKAGLDFDPAFFNAFNFIIC